MGNFLHFNALFYRKYPKTKCIIWVLFISVIRVFSSDENVEHTHVPQSRTFQLDEARIGTRRTGNRGDRTPSELSQILRES